MSARARMDPERWRRIETLYHSALTCEPADRDAFLDRSCEGDSALRQEVERLLRESSSEGPLDRPSWEPAELTAVLPKDARLGAYQIVEQLGAGGMGVVYKARDPRLDRMVAIKVSNGLFTSRFEREARAVAALNHPHICTLYDVGPNYLVMEYIEGETLAERLAKAPLRLDEALHYGTQIADALAAAHEAGIVHRDLKPANVMLSGVTAKVFDFGLAKRECGDSTLTAKGAMLGTLAYMAPEQLDEGTADHRSDIFSFGCVLHEMLTGRKPFEGKSDASLISAIMTSEPRPVSAAQRRAPPALDRLVLKCLAKDPNERWQSSHDLAAELQWIATRPAHRIRTRRLRLPVIAAMVFAVAVTAVLLRWQLGSPRPADVGPAVRFAVAMPPGASARSSDTAALSPDGARLVFTATTSAGSALYMRSMDEVDFRPLYPKAAFPFWSPDGRAVAFFSGGKLIKLNLADGAAAVLCAARTGPGGTWNQRGIILFSDGATAALSQVRDTGGIASPVTSIDPARGERAHLWPSFLPDGKHFLFTVISKRPDIGGIYVSSLDSRQTMRLAPVMSNAQYSGGFLLFVQGDAVMAQRFDAATQKLDGEPFQVAEPALASETYIGPTFSIGGMVGSVVARAQRSDTARQPPSSGGPVNMGRTPRPSVGEQGRSGVAMMTVDIAYDGNPGASLSVGGNAMAFRAGGSTATRMVWFDRGGIRVGYLGERASYSNPALSPDGRSLAVCIRDAGANTRDIWLFDLTGGARKRFTFDPADDLNPVWSPDGQRIAFTSDRSQQRDLFVRSAAGAGPETTLFQSPLFKNSEDWTWDRNYVVFNARTQDGKRNLYALPLVGDRQPIPLATGPFTLDQGQVSPDGRWLAFRSQESGRYEVRVQSFPTAKGSRRVSNAGGTDPQWSRDGSELFYIENERRLMAVRLKSSGANLEPGVPQALFEAQFSDIGRNRYVVAPDGRRFLAIIRDVRSPGEISVLVNGLSRKR